MSSTEQGAQTPTIERAPAAAPAPAPKPRPVDPKSLPPYRVLLHNDDHSDMGYVVRTIRKLTPLDQQRALVVMMTAHTTGIAQVLITHKERAELYVEQFASCKLTATTEPVG